MSQPYIGEIRLFGGNFAPRDWFFCNGQILSIAEYETLYALIGTTYGGDGVQTFALPDLRGRLAVGEGTGPGLTPRVIGESSGTEQVTLTVQQIPGHSHAALATTAAGNLPGPTSAAVPASPSGANSTLYSIPGTTPFAYQNFLPGTIGVTGGNQPHTNLMPSLCVSFIIATAGVFPSRN